MKLWVGKEMEGKFKDVYTLFIGSKTIKFEDIKKAIFDRPTICQLYFGAGMCTPINQEVVRECRQRYKTFVITLEIDIKQIHKYDFSLLKNVQLIITHTHNNYSIVNRLIANNTQIKVQSLKENEEVVALSKLSTFYLTDVKELQGKKYKGDVVIE